MRRLNKPPYFGTIETYCSRGNQIGIYMSSSWQWYLRLCQQALLRPLHYIFIVGSSFAYLIWEMPGCRLRWYPEKAVATFLSNMEIVVVSMKIHKNEGGSLFLKGFLPRFASRGERIWTSDHHNPIVVRYRAALRPVIENIGSIAELEMIRQGFVWVKLSGYAPLRTHFRWCII